MTREPLRPHPLRPGDAVAVVAPSGPVQPDRLDAGLEALRRWGFEPVEMPHVRDRRGHHAGSDDDRLADLQAALDDPAVRAVWTARGGSGLTRIIDRLDFAALAADPKPIVGFSDITVLLQAAWQRVRLITFHGQFVLGAPQLAEHPVAADHLLGLLGGAPAPRALPWLPGAPAPRTVAAGVAEGRLLGGNLALLSVLVGTPTEVDLRGAVVFIEDVNETPYRLDRLLTHLRSAGRLDGVAGLVAGTFHHGRLPDDVPSASVDEVIADRLGDLGVPVLAGLPIGHEDNHLALPHGARVRLDAGARTLELMEAVTD